VVGSGLMGALFERRGAMVSDQGTICGRKSDDRAFWRRNGRSGDGDTDGDERRVYGRRVVNRWSVCWRGHACCEHNGTDEIICEPADEQREFGEDLSAMGDLQTLLPGFQSSVSQLNTALLAVCLVLGFGGLVREVSLCYGRGSVSALPPYLVKVFIAFAALGLMQTWAGYLTGMVTDLNSQLGINNGNVLATYEQALSTKFGTIINNTGTAATTQNAANAQVNPSTGFNNGASAPGGVRITHYGYPGDPNSDPNSANGIGNHSNQLIAGQSIAFSPDLIAEYHLQVGQSVTITLANGQVLTGTFDDTTAANLTGRVDIYDPNNSITFDGASVASIDGTAAVAGFATGVAASPVTLFTTAAMGLDGLAAFLLGGFVLILGVIGMFLMWLFSILQQFLTGVAIAVSPIFFGLLLIRGLDGIASRFLTGFVALSLWPLGWGIANLVTTLLLDFALNTANNPALGAINYLSGGVLWWLALGLWTMGSTLAAPWMISRTLAAAQPGIAALLGEVSRPAMALASYTIKLGGLTGSGGEGSSPASLGGGSLAAEGEPEEFLPLTTLGRIRRFGRRPE
jgi:hypothetical protein